MKKQEFYNAELKNRFLTENELTGSMGGLFDNVFRLVAPYEEKYGADVCTWGEEETRDILERIAGFREYSSKNRENLLKRYVRWCIGIGVPGASNAIFGITSDGLARVREHTMSGPEHMQRCLDSFLSPERDKTTDNILRGYCWLAFSGMSDREIVNASVEDVDLSHLSIRASGDLFPLYAESVACLRILCGLSAFKFSHPSYGADYIWRPRADGNKLLRGLRSPDPSVMNIRSRLSKLSSEAFRNGTTDVKISYYRLWISGEFYRMYQREMAGKEPDFTYLAERGMLEKEREGKPYKLESGNARRTPESKKRELAKNFGDDYARWKLAYKL